MTVLVSMHLALLSFGHELILLLEELHDLGIVYLLHPPLVNLLLRNLLDLQHYLVQPRGVYQAVPQPLTLVEQEIHVQVAQDLLLQALHQLLFDGRCQVVVTGGDGR